MSGLARLIARDVQRAWTGGGAALPVAFFLLAAILFPFAVGPDSVLLARIGGGVIWAAALLAALLPVERLVAPDLDAGVIDQLLVRGFSPVAIAAAKTVAHWIAFAPPLLLAATLVAGLFGLSGPMLATILCGLAIGTPALAALAVATSALTAGLRGAGALAGLLNAAAGGAVADLGARRGRGG